MNFFPHLVVLYNHNVYITTDQGKYMQDNANRWTILGQIYCISFKLIVIATASPKSKVPASEVLTATDMAVQHHIPNSFQITPTWKVKRYFETFWNISVFNNKHFWPPRSAHSLRSTLPGSLLISEPVNTRTILVKLSRTIFKNLVNFSNFCSRRDRITNGFCPVNN